MNDAGWITQPRNGWISTPSKFRPSTEWVGHRSAEPLTIGLDDGERAARDVPQRVGAVRQFRHLPARAPPPRPVWDKERDVRVRVKPSQDQADVPRSQLELDGWNRLPRRRPV